MNPNYYGPILATLLIVVGVGLYWAAYTIGYRLRWHVLGWRPYIYDHDIIVRVVSEVLAEAILVQAKRAELTGQPLTEEQKSNMIHLQPLLHKAIDRYIEIFGGYP